MTNGRGGASGKGGGGKRPSRKKSSGRKRKAASPLAKLWKKRRADILIGGVTALLAFSAAFLMGGGCDRREEVYIPPQPVYREPTRTPAPTLAPTPTATPTPQPTPTPVPSPQVKKDLRPKIAIIIDDLGGSERQATALLAIDEPITFAVLPHLPRSEYVATQAFLAKRIVMLHQPMAPQSKTMRPGPGLMREGDSDQRLRQTLEKNLASVPFASGVNNHMGSRFTELPTEMGYVMKELKRRGLFFIDSRTTARTVALTRARRLGVPSARRHVFLDNERKVEVIAAQLEALAAHARKTGSAIGIGHPYPETIKALRTTLPRLTHSVRVVPITELLR